MSHNTGSYIKTRRLGFLRDPSYDSHCKGVSYESILVAERADISRWRYSWTDVLYIGNAKESPPTLRYRRNVVPPREPHLIQTTSNHIPLPPSSFLLREIGTRSSDIAWCMGFPPPPPKKKHQVFSTRSPQRAGVCYSVVCLMV